MANIGQNRSTYSAPDLEFLEADERLQKALREERKRAPDSFKEERLLRTVEGFKYENRIPFSVSGLEEEDAEKPLLDIKHGSKIIPVSKVLSDEEALSAFDVIYSADSSWAFAENDPETGIVRFRTVLLRLPWKTIERIKEPRRDGVGLATGSPFFLYFLKKRLSITLMTSFAYQDLIPERTSETAGKNPVNELGYPESHIIITDLWEHFREMTENDLLLDRDLAPLWKDDPEYPSWVSIPTIENTLFWLLFELADSEFSPFPIDLRCSVCGERIRVTRQPKRVGDYTFRIDDDEASSGRNHFIRSEEGRKFWLVCGREEKNKTRLFFSLGFCPHPESIHWSLNTDGKPSFIIRIDKFLESFSRVLEFLLLVCALRVELQMARDRQRSCLLLFDGPISFYSKVFGNSLVRAARNLMRKLGESGSGLEPNFEVGFVGSKKTGTIYNFFHRRAQALVLKAVKSGVEEEVRPQSFKDARKAKKSQKKLKKKMKKAFQERRCEILVVPNSLCLLRDIALERKALAKKLKRLTVKDLKADSPSQERSPEASSRRKEDLDPHGEKSSIGREIIYIDPRDKSVFVFHFPYQEYEEGLRLLDDFGYQKRKQLRFPDSFLNFRKTLKVLIRDLKGKDYESELIPTSEAHRLAYLSPQLLPKIVLKSLILGHSEGWLSRND